MIERTLAIIKPEAMFTCKEFILTLIKYNKFNFVNCKLTKMTKDMAKEFYKEHEGKDFFDRYVDHMSDKFIEVYILECEDAINKWRELMGSTDPSQARVGTIRYMFGKKTEGAILNCVHGSSSKESYKREAKMFFDEI